MLKKVVKWVGGRLWDLATNNVSLVITWAAGSGLMFYLGSITEWANLIGPLGWALIAVATMLVVSFGFYLWSLGTINRSTEVFAKQKAAAGGVNVLAPSHDHERINLADFYSPYLQYNENVRFTDCELLGPAGVFLDQCSLKDLLWLECEIVIVRDDRRVKGVVAFKNAFVLRGKLIRATVFMSYAQYQLLPDEIKTGVPVISDGRIGDV